MENHHSPPVFHEDASMVSKWRIDLESSSVLMNIMGLILKGYWIQNPNKVLLISQKSLTIRRRRVTQQQSESFTGRRDAPRLQQ